MTNSEFRGTVKKKKKSHRYTMDCNSRGFKILQHRNNKQRVVSCTKTAHFPVVFTFHLCTKNLYI